MNLTIFFVVLVCIISSVSILSFGLGAEGLIGHTPKLDVTKFSIRTSERILSKLSEITKSSLSISPKNPCSQLITQAATIKKLLNSTEESCTWTIQAPEKHVVFVDLLEVVSKINEEYPPTGVVDVYDNKFSLSFFDGDRPSESNSLFRFGESQLNNTLSTTRDLTIQLHYVPSERYLSHFVKLRFGFIEKSKIVE